MSVINIIRSDFREFWVWLSNWLFYRKQAIKLSLAISLADMKQKAYNKQYHVMVLDLPTGEKLVSVNEKDIERFKRKRWIPKRIGMIELKRTSFFYSTPVNRNNTASRDERKAAHEKYQKYSKRYMK